jgi:hypothetical protein
MSKNPRTVVDVGKEATRLGIYDQDVLQGAIKVFWAAGWEPAVKALKSYAEQNNIKPPKRRYE